MQRDHKVESIRKLTDDCFVLRLERHDLKFDAGQLVSLGPRGIGVNREYSIYSGETDSSLEFLVRRVKDGTVSPLLGDLAQGAKVFVLGPYSDFKIKNTAKMGRPHVLVATGTGIAPYRAMARSIPDLDYRIVHGVRKLDERYDAVEYPAERYLACVSGPEGPAAAASGRGIFSGRVTGWLRESELPKNGIYYLCGNNHMINEAYEILRARGVSPDDIQSEVFF